jgi:nucleoside-diphosphate-sugar epimerase
MRITILGAGYLGTALARHLHGRRDHAVAVTTTRAARRQELRAVSDAVHVLEGSDADAMAQSLAGSEVAVLTLAPTGTRQVGPEAYEDTYLSTVRSLRRILKGLPRLGQILYTGSCSVYGDAGGGWVDESTPPAPGDRHGEILLRAEQELLACGAGGRRACVLRLGAIHGPGREPGRRIRALAGSTRPGRGDHHCNWIHRDDAVGAIAFALERGLEGVINVVDDHPITVRDLMQAACRAEGLAPVRWDPAAATGPAPPDRRVSNRRLHRLGFRLRHPRLRLDAPRSEPGETP